MTIHQRFAFITLITLSAGSAVAQTTWSGLLDASSDLRTSTFSFTGTIAEAYDGNENYYDGDMADFDGDGLMDRALGARYGLLKNTGGGRMTPYASVGLVNYLFRGVSPGWGEDAFQWADVDNDNDLDILQGGNGEPFTLQINSAGRFRTKWTKSGSALNIVNTDIEKDGDVDLIVAHSFCSDVSCGHGCPETNCASTFPKEFHLWVNDGTGNFTDQATTRGFTQNYGTNLICGVVSGDVDNDGDFDFMLINGIGRGITLCRNSGTGNFTRTLIPFGVALAPIRPVASGFSQGMNLGDIDNDGDLDLVCALLRDSAGTPHPQVGHAVFINDGTGGFSEQTLQRVTVTNYTGFLTGGNGKLVDLDYDGDFDFVALDVRTSNNFLQVFLNDGAGLFTFSTIHSRTIARQSLEGGTGADVDITDLNGDGVYDVWLGAAGQDVRTLINTYQLSNGIPPNIPRNFRVLSADTNGITLAWQHPAYADIARRYKVYRSTMSGLARQDRRLLKHVGMSRHQDEGFAAPITRFTTTVYLNDPDVVLVGSTNEVQFTDRTAVPGIAYYYCVTHVGTENIESPLSGEQSASIVSATGTDATRPLLEIVSPTSQDWYVFPKIVLHLGDGKSGIDPATLRVSFNQPLGNPAAGGRAAGADVTDIFFRKDAKGFIAVLPPPLSLPTNVIATITASIADHGGISTTGQVQFLPAIHPLQPPVARITRDRTNGLMPLTVTLSATNSTDADGKLFRHEWFFSNGETAIGPTIQKTFRSAGPQSAILLVRDNQGHVNTATQIVSVAALQITRWTNDSSGFRIYFPTVSNRNYIVERADTLPATWTELGQLTGNNSERSFLDSTPAQQRFYRLRTE